MHGLSVSVSDREIILWPQDGPDDLLRIVTTPSGGFGGAVYGLVSQAEATSIVVSMAHGADPSRVDSPWIAAAIRDRNTIVATASMMLGSGVFWAQFGGTLHIASDPRTAALQSFAGATIDGDYIRQRSVNYVPTDTSPFKGVRRVPAGRTALWRSPVDEPQVTEWCGPGVWEEPTLSGPDAMTSYLETFDALLGDLSGRAGRPVCALSGGLDSTFVAAGLAVRTDVDRPVLGLIYAPLPEALVESVGGWDADETHLAELLADQFAGRVVIRRVVNTSMIRPLVAAAEESMRSGIPVLNPGNQVWLSAIREIARDAGSRAWFVGGMGNAAFSGDHFYAARFAIQRFQPMEIIALCRNEQGQLSKSLLRSQVLRPLYQEWRRRESREVNPFAQFGLGATEVPKLEPRQAFLEWLAGCDTGLSAAANPGADQGILKTDPYTARAVIELAARITPTEWQRGGIQRGFARRAGRGRVPDAIRNRRRRGQQGWDTWYVVRNDRDQYLDRILGVGDAPGLEHVDYRALASHVAAWPWGEPVAGDLGALFALDRLLALSEFAMRPTVPQVRNHPVTTLTWPLDSGAR